MINSLHVDLLINLYRCSMKLDEEQGILESKGSMKDKDHLPGTI